MFGAVIYEVELVVGGGFAIDCDFSDTLIATLRILDFYLVLGFVVAVGDRVFLPMRRNARIEDDRIAVFLESQQVFHAGAVHPAGSAGIPGPSASAGVWVHRIYICRHHVRFQFISGILSLTFRMVDGIDEFEQLPGLVSIAHFCIGDDRSEERRGG